MRRVAEKTATSRPAGIPLTGLVFPATPGKSRRYSKTANIGSGLPLVVGVFSTYGQASTTR